MTSLYDRNWPVGFAEQKSLVKQILNRTQSVVNKAQSVFIRSVFQPTRQEWETAYVAQLGQPLPIPVGVKLEWFNLTKGQIETFITTNDGVGGLTSSGDVFQLLDDNWDRPSIRLIGYSNTAIFDRPSSGSTTLSPYPADGEIGNFGFGLNYNQTYEWADKGLDSLIYLYKIRSPQTFGTIRLRFFETDSGLTSPFPWVENFGATNYILSSFIEFTLAATTVGTGDNTSGADVSNAMSVPASLANGFSQGVVFVQNIAQRIKTLGGIPTPGITPVDDDVAPTALHIGSYIGTGLTTSQVAVEVGSAEKIDEYHPRTGFGTVGSGGLVLGEIWMYGLFKSLTGRM